MASEQLSQLKGRIEETEAAIQVQRDGLSEALEYIAQKANDSSLDGVEVYVASAKRHKQEIDRLGGYAQGLKYALNLIDVPEETEEVEIEILHNYDAALKLFTGKVQDVFDNVETPLKDKVVVTSGQRYDKVCRASIDDPEKAGSVYAFVEKSTGDIFKPAGWSAPAKGARGSIYKPETYEHADAHGGWLYAR